MNKLLNLPHIYYINSESKPELKHYTEQNFKRLGIFNFTRVSDKNFSVLEYEQWKDLLHHKDKVVPEIVDEISFSILIINTIKNWLETTNDSNMIIMSDSVDFQYIKYLDFDWDYLINNLPHDWDSILLGFEDLLGVIPCFLHPVRDSQGFGPTLVNRRYAEKIVEMHFYENKYNFFGKISNNFWKNKLNFISHNYFLNQSGRNYALPLLPKNSQLVIDKYFNQEKLELTHKLYSIFWKKIKPKMNTEQFFTFFSKDDLFLSKNIKNLKIRRKDIP